MVVRAKVCELTDGFLWFVCGVYVGILTSPLKTFEHLFVRSSSRKSLEGDIFVIKNEN